MDGSEPSQTTTLVTLVVQYYRKLTRGPYGAGAALHRLKEGKEEDPLQTILAEESELAWRAYYAASKGTESDHGFAGKAEMTRKLTDLRAQPVENQRTFAQQLARAIDGDEAGSPKQTAKRRRIFSSTAGNMAITSVPSTGTTNLTGSENLTLEQGSGQGGFQPGVYVGVPLEAAVELFQEQFWDSIQRIRSKEQLKLSADISMLFQQGDVRERFGCQMDIGIAEEKIADLAFELFDVKMEIKDGIRSVRYPGGGKIEPDPSIKLRACRQDLSSIFRGDLLEAVRTSPIYQREKTELRNRTDGVSMTISNEAKQDGRLTVWLGEWKASTIKARFYG